jgi:hypothetical protein
MQSDTLTTKPTVPANSGTTVPGLADSAVERALFIPELLEMVLENVRLCDLFNAAAVCRTWKAIFENSHPLHIKAQLKNDPNGKCCEDEFDHKLGLLVAAQAPNPARNNTIFFELSFLRVEYRPIRLTANLRRCLATQPACKEMAVETWCCGPEREYII